jgi:hypothetical protein
MVTAMIVFFVLTGSGPNPRNAATSIPADDHVHFEHLSWQRIRLSHRNAKSYPYFSQSPALPCVGPFLAPGIIGYRQASLSLCTFAARTFSLPFGSPKRKTPERAIHTRRELRNRTRPVRESWVGLPKVALFSGHGPQPTHRVDEKSEQPRVEIQIKQDPSYTAENPLAIIFHGAHRRKSQSGVWLFIALQREG